VQRDDRPGAPLVDLLADPRLTAADLTGLEASVAVVALGHRPDGSGGIDQPDRSRRGEQRLVDVGLATIDLGRGDGRRDAEPEAAVDATLAGGEAEQRLAPLGAIFVYGIHQAAQDALPAMRHRDRDPGDRRHRHHSATWQGQLDLIGPGGADDLAAVERHPEAVEVEDLGVCGAVGLGVGDREGAPVERVDRREHVVGRDCDVDGHRPSVVRCGGRVSSISRAWL